MNGEMVAIIALLAVIGYQGWLIRDDRKRADEREKDLLCRIMARNYETFVQGEVAKAQVDRPLTPEEIFEMQQERGIPV